MIVMIRERIGSIKNDEDIWYTIDYQTDIEKLKNTIQEDIEKFIIPYFNKFTSLGEISSSITGSYLSVHKIALIGLYGNKDWLQRKIDLILEKYKGNTDYLLSRFVVLSGIIQQ